jgi:hypothetical protein
MLTKKDYKELASIIKRNTSNAGDVDNPDGWWVIEFQPFLNDLCWLLKLDNVRFNGEKFIAACKEGTE